MLTFLISLNLDLLIDLGNQPWGNDFLTKDQIKQGIKPEYKYSWKRQNWFKKKFFT